MAVKERIKRTKRYFSKEFKLAVVEQVLSGDGIGGLSQEFDLNKSLICHWVKAYREFGESGLESKRNPGNNLLSSEAQKKSLVENQLRYELAKKEIELAKLKKLLEYQRGNAQKTN